MSFRKNVVFAAVGGFMSLAVAAPLANADAVTDRQTTMKGVGDAMKALAAIAKGEADFDAAVVKSNAEKLAKLMEDAKAMFPEGSLTGEKPSRAKPEIWSDNANFVKIFDDSIAAAKEVAGAADVGALRQTLGGLGKNGCKACHDGFRAPKE